MVISRAIGIALLDRNNFEIDDVPDTVPEGLDVRERGLVWSKGSNLTIPGIGLTLSIRIGTAGEAKEPNATFSLVLMEQSIRCHLVSMQGCVGVGRLVSGP